MSEEHAAVIGIGVVVGVIVEVGELGYFVTYEFFVDETAVVDVVVGGDVFSEWFLFVDIVDVVAVELVDNAVGVTHL